MIGVWSSTDRQRLQASGAAAARAGKGVKPQGPAQGPERRPEQGQQADFVQVSRLGNPLINEVVIPLGLKDQFNATQPADDAKNYGKFVLNPELARLINVLYPGLNVPETNRTDIVQALLTGLPGKTQIAPNAGCGRHAQAEPGRAAGAERRAGSACSAATSPGFPDGRRLERRRRRHRGARRRRLP